MSVRSTTIKLFSFALLTLLLFTWTSCKRSCDLPESVDAGVIIPKAIVVPKSGYLTDNMNGYYLVSTTSNENLASEFDVKYSAAENPSSVDFNSYSILANPMVVPCDVTFERSVTVDDLNGIVNYHVKAIACTKSNCVQDRSVENYVMVPAIPSGYIVLFTNEVVKN